MKKIAQNLLLVLSSVLLSLLVFEVLIRLFIFPSEKAYGTLFGRELPPFRMIPTEAPDRKDSDDNGRTDWYKNLVVGGKKISRGDLWGFHKEDAMIGYLPEENRVSANGWWQSNNLGARSRLNTAPAIPQGQKRILIFGDSFANGSRVPQEDTWPSVLNSEMTGVEVVNFGVDGYSMGQSLLRYRSIKNKLDYDIVTLMIVPVADLWRDINTLRSLGEADWGTYAVYPRFVVTSDGLKLVASPYQNEAQVIRENGEWLSEKLKTYLHRYDRFYFKSQYEQPWLIGHSIAYKLIARADFIFRKKQLLSEAVYGPPALNSEAVRVADEIFRTMKDEAAREGKKFILIILPEMHALTKLKQRKPYRHGWAAMVELFCGGGMACIDLTPALNSVPLALLDSGYDGSHFGPETNRRIAAAVRNELENRFLGQ